MTTSDKLAFVAIGISILTFIFAWYSFSKTDELSKTAFYRNYRPYILCNTFGYIDKNDGLLYADMNQLGIKVLNAPALMTTQHLLIYSRENNSDSLLFELKVGTNQLIYPTDVTQTTITADPTKVNHDIATQISPKTLVRKIRIEYQWVSDSNLKYYYESTWTYVVKDKHWMLLSQSAN